MKLVACLLLASAVRVVSVMAQTNVPQSLTVDGTTYPVTRFGRITATSVTVFCSNGVATLPLAKLPPDLQKALGYDPVKLAQQQATAKEASEKANAVARTPLTGDDLVAWKFALSQLMAKDGSWRDYSACRPEAWTMVRTGAGDYQFSFPGKGKSTAYYNEHAHSAYAGGQVVYAGATEYIQQPDVQSKVTVVIVGNDLRIGEISTK